MPFTPAADQLDHWMRGAQALALLDAAQQAGLLDLLTEPRTVDDLTAFAGRPADDLVAALEAHGIVVRTGPEIGLEPGLAERLSPGAPQDLAAQISRAALLARQVTDVVRSGSTVPAAGEQLTIARSFALNPGDTARSLVEALLDELPEFRDAITNGRMLDVGSGVSGFTLTAATLLPGLRATTLEVLPEPAAVAAARARALGVADRVDTRVVDARDFSDPEPFDAAFWAQPFFPDPSRPATMAMILRSLRPGGVLIVQQLDTEPAGDGPQRAAFTLARLVARAQGLPFARPLAEVVRELTGAGFELIRTPVTGLGPVALLRRPGQRR